MLTAAFVVFAVIPSTLDVNVPSKDSTPTNNVNIIPNPQTILDFINFDNFVICTLSLILDTIFKTIIIEITGNIKFLIKLVLLKYLLLYFPYISLKLQVEVSKHLKILLTVELYHLYLYKYL